ncbi:PREDICTED: zinc finger protein 658B-like [Nicrophorus vespilloides]|uniref:Zinc finger protein 658B-like n=1 Tax=Nicrophorus vespilloides TaxID=110193 RepID=A0ABM1M800_NICVS|nr:PREDICTED: zinc finger protein 658B-like [Nicrophorus vespilloides]
MTYPRAVDRWWGLGGSRAETRRVARSLPACSASPVFELEIPVKSRILSNKAQVYVATVLITREMLQAHSSNFRESLEHWKTRAKMCSNSKYRCGCVQMVRSNELLLCDAVYNYFKSHAKMQGSTKHHDPSCSCQECEEKDVPVPVMESEALNLSAPSTSRERKPVRRKEFKCNDCDKTFTHKGDYNKHLRIHSGEKPYTCTVCDKKFAHTSNLTRHLNVHSGLKPFHCDICDKSFARKDKLEAHRNTKICSKRRINSPQ